MEDSENKLIDFPPLQQYYCTVCKSQVGGLVGGVLDL